MPSLNIRTAILENKLITLLFLSSLSFYLAQHASGYSWDFSAYAMNARYFAGTYFEWFRPPLAPFAILLLGFVGWLAAEYLYIAAVSALHLFSAIKFSKVYI